jgi:hypothetical protein
MDWLQLLNDNWGIGGLIIGLGLIVIFQILKSKLVDKIDKKQAGTFFKIGTYTGCVLIILGLIVVLIPSTKKEDENKGEYYHNPLTVNFSDGIKATVLYDFQMSMTDDEIQFLKAVNRFGTEEKIMSYISSNVRNELIKELEKIPYNLAKNNRDSLEMLIIESTLSDQENAGLSISNFHINEIEIIKSSH